MLNLELKQKPLQNKEKAVSGVCRRIRGKEKAPVLNINDLGNKIRGMGWKHALNNSHANIGTFTLQKREESIHLSLAERD